MLFERYVMERYVNPTVGTKQITLTIPDKLKSKNQRNYTIN